MSHAPHNWPTAVLFDFDGVIVHSEPLHYRAFAEVAAGERLTLTEDEYYSELIGFDDRGAFTHLYAMKDLPLEPADLLRLMATKSQIVRDLMARGEFHALPGADELIRGLAPHYHLAICSGALRNEIESMLDGIGLREFFKIIVAAEDVTHGKPNPEGYLLTTHLLSEATHQPIRPADCLIIEDAPSVARSVRAVGFPVLAVATSYPIEHLADANWAVKSLRPAEVLAKLPQLKLSITPSR